MKYDWSHGRSEKKLIYRRYYFHFPRLFNNIFEAASNQPIASDTTVSIIIMPN